MGHLDFLHLDARNNPDPQQQASTPQKPFPFFSSSSFIFSSSPDFLKPLNPSPSMAIYRKRPFGAGEARLGEPVTYG